MSESLVEQRRQKAADLQQLGLEAYPNHFQPNQSVAGFVRQYSPLKERSEQHLQDANAPIEKLAGRVVAQNKFGKALFLRIQDGSCGLLGDDQQVNPDRLQLYLQQKTLPEQDWAALKCLDLGDIIGVEGTPMVTKTGELTLACQRFTIVSKALRPMPEKWHGLEDKEIRYRQRYLDLIDHAEVRRLFVQRSNIIQALRIFFLQQNFLEVETPTLHPVPGGANAKPFVTHHNALHADLYLRIAPELYLKRLLVGGFDRVFEIGRNFRNEGISTLHNPEFTMMECYQAYGDCQQLAQLLEQLFAHLVSHCLSKPQVEWLGHTIDLQPPFRRMTMVEAIATFGSLSQDEVLDPIANQRLLEQRGVAAAPLSVGQRIATLFELLAEPHLIQPTLIFDYPVDISPLARKKTSDALFCDRFEFFVAGKEIANAFSELNDPIEQRERFEQQALAKAAGDEEAHSIDESYLRALEHGMPPAGGLGIGIDRLVMLLCGASGIRDVVLFPQMRSESEPKT